MMIVVIVVPTVEEQHRARHLFGAGASRLIRGAHGRTRPIPARPSPSPAPARPGWRRPQPASSGWPQSDRPRVRSGRPLRGGIGGVDVGLLVPAAPLVDRTVLLDQQPVVDAG